MLEPCMLCSGEEDDETISALQMAIANAMEAKNKARNRKNQALLQAIPHPCTPIS